MESEKSKPRERFAADSRRYLQHADALVRRLKQGSQKSEDIHELFRCIHSIKSEGSYLRFREVTSIAHELESGLDKARREITMLDKSSVAAIEQQLGKLQKAISDVNEPEADITGSQTPLFNMFEKKLLNEAHRRGDRFYRVRCQLDDKAPMKKARAYLILSNLEQISNVIRMQPPIQSTEDRVFLDLSFYLTADIREDAIYACVDIDQVTGAQIEILDFQPTGNILGAREALAIEAPSFFRISEQKITRLSEYANELNMALKELQLSPERGGIDLANTIDLSQNIIGELKSVRVSRLDEEFSRLEELATDISAQLGKELSIDFEGEHVEIDRRLLTILSDPLNHLVRNAIDHGVESPAERAGSRKPAKGSVQVIAGVKGERIEIVVRDDGKGIDEALIRRRSAELSHQIRKSDGLIDMLSRPGFTTLEEATDLSGRGVGLDLVVQRIRSVGGIVTVSTAVGKGSAFTISVPRGATYSQLLFFRFGKLLYALPTGAVEHIERLTQGDLQKDRKERIFYRRIPAFAADRPAVAATTPSLGRYAIVTSHLQKQACFLADDLLFEHDMPDSDADKLRQQKHRHSVRIGSEKREFLYLSPGAVVGS
ncbi:MAG: hypothetical protein CMN78_04780 [Spirochaetales bacterium]|nr:hypothetical protein [Spirochaetales bacterium]